jgi:hypothetical protein
MGKNKWLSLFSAVVASSVPRSGVDEEESDVQTGLVLSSLYMVGSGIFPVGMDTSDMLEGASMRGILIESAILGKCLSLSMGNLSGND